MILDLNTSQFSTNSVMSNMKTGVVFDTIFGSYECLWDKTYVENPERFGSSSNHKDS